MKKLVTLLVLCLLVLCAAQMGNAQELSAEDKAIVQSISDVIDDSTKVKTIMDSLGPLAETKPLLQMAIYQKLLLQSRRENNKRFEAIALGAISYSYRMMGQTVNSLEFSLESVRVAELSNDSTVLMDCTHDLAHNYKDQGQFSKAIAMYTQVAKYSESKQDHILQSLAMMNLGEVYLAKGQPDSALTFSQRAYEIFLQIKYLPYLSSVLGHLGRSHSELGNDELALTFFEMALKEATKLESPRYVNRANASFAFHYNKRQEIDSAIVYSKRAIDAVQNTSFSNLVMKPAKLLGEIYKNSDSDSALKYMSMYLTAYDSLYNAKSIQEVQSLTFENELKRQEKEMEMMAQRQEHKRQIQFALIGLGILTFIIIFLMLSRSFITNTRIISFLGVIALLIVFEFLNLLLHPFLERVTHHSPVLMLLALVCMAALLVPFHHRLERWAVAKLVEKNRQIRLASAKKTISELEKDLN